MDHGIIGVVDLGWRLIVHSLVGPFPLTLAIVAAYGLMIKGVQAQAMGDATGAIFHGVVGLLAIPVFIVLLFLWGVAIDLSFSSSLFVWSVTLAGGRGYAYFATKWEHGRADLADSLRIAA